MANHLKRQIREAAATTLTGLGVTAARVFQSRARLVQEADLPCLRIYCTDEVIVFQSMGPERTRKRLVQLVVEGLCEANADTDDTADQINKEVEVALDGNNSLGGLAKYVEPREVKTEYGAVGEKTVALTVMKFEVLCFTRKGAPDVPL